jgi:hypothetical protein
MSREIVKPFLVTKDEQGAYRLTIRDTRFNSQGYPIVTATLLDDLFKTASAAKAHARDHYKAEPGQYATK